MTHDPLCPTQTMCKCKDQECWDCRDVVLCQCDLIAKVIIREASLAVIGAAGHLVEQRAHQFSLDEVCARLGLDAQRVRDLADERVRAHQ